MEYVRFAVERAEAFFCNNFACCRMRNIDGRSALSGPSDQIVSRLNLCGEISQQMACAVTRVVGRRPWLLAPAMWAPLGA